MSRMIKTATNSYLVSIAGDKTKIIIEAIDLNTHVVYQHVIVTTTRTAIDISFTYEIEIEKYSDHLRMTITEERRYIGTYDLKQITDISAKVVDNKIIECLALSVEKRANKIVSHVNRAAISLDQLWCLLFAFVVGVAIIQFILFLCIVGGTKDINGNINQVKTMVAAVQKMIEKSG